MKTSKGSPFFPVERLLLWNDTKQTEKCGFMLFWYFLVMSMGKTERVEERFSSISLLSPPLAFWFFCFALLLTAARQSPAFLCDAFFGISLLLLVASSYLKTLFLIATFLCRQTDSCFRNSNAWTDDTVRIIFLPSLSCAITAVRACFDSPIQTDGPWSTRRVSCYYLLVWEVRLCMFDGTQILRPATAADQLGWYVPLRESVPAFDVYGRSREDVTTVFYV